MISPNNRPQPVNPEPPEASEQMGPAPRRRGRIPLVTLALVILNLLMSLGQFAASGFELRRGEIGAPPVDFALGAKVPSLVAHGEYWRLVTASFLHGDWVHLGWNMLSLVVFGFIIETFYGRARMLVIFTLSAVAGVVASYLFTPTTSLGASTGIMGLMGALLVHNHRYRAFLPPRLNRQYPLLFAVLLVQLSLDFFSIRVDRFGHLGGLAGGMLMAALLESRVAGARQAERDWLPLPTALATTLALYAYGTWGLMTSLPGNADLILAGRARGPQSRAQRIAHVLERQPYFAELRFSYIETLLRLGQVDDAGRQYELMVRRYPVLTSSAAGELLRNRLLLFQYERARQSMRSELWEEALASYDFIIRHIPLKETTNRFKGMGEVLAEVYNSHAWLLVDKVERDLPKAEQYALRATQMEPKNSAYQDTLAWIYYKQGRLQDALAKQQEALRLFTAVDGPSPTQADARAELNYHLGAIYEKLGQKAEAVTHYTRAVEAKSDLAPAVEGLRRLGWRPAVPEPDPTPVPRERVLPEPALQRGII